MGFYRPVLQLSARQCHEPVNREPSGLLSPGTADIVNEMHEEQTERAKNETREGEDVMKAMRDLTRQVKLRTFLGDVFLWLAISAWSGMSVDGQEITRRDQVQLLPPSTGEALTLAPNNMPDINCSILDWKDSQTHSGLLCPPQHTFAPVYLYLKLSWLKSEDVPSSIRRITAPVKTVTKNRTTKSAAWVRLGVKEKPDVAPHATWVAFTAVADIALLTLPTKR
jgi:hypothetical protein